MYRLMTSEGTAMFSIYTLIALFVGLLLGWNAIPQPKWAADFYAKIVAWIKSWFGNIT